MVNERENKQEVTAGRQTGTDTFGKLWSFTNNTKKLQ
jgi:hypothetical protein